MTHFNNLDFWKTHSVEEFKLLYEAYDEKLWNNCRYVSDSEWVKWKSYENAEINGTKSIAANSLREGWDFARRIDDYGTDISHTHVTVDWYASHEDYLKTMMGRNISDASKEYQQMMKLRDLRYRVLLKKHYSMR